MSLCLHCQSDFPEFSGKSTLTMCENISNKLFVGFGQSEFLVENNQI